jgi:hypothetical protein
MFDRKRGRLVIAPQHAVSGQELPTKLSQSDAP